VANLDPVACAKDLKAGRLAPLYVFVGEDTRRKDQFVDLIEATIDEADRPFAVERLYGGEAGGSPIDIAAAARALPMLGDRRVVIVLRAERLLKPKRASKAAELDDDAAEPEAEAADFGPLEDYVAAPVPSTTLVFVATDVDRTRRFTKKLLQAAAVVSCAGLSAANAAGRREAAHEARRLIEEDLSALGRAIEPAAVELLVERAGGDINRLRGDIERLLLYTEGQRRITKADVAEVASTASGVEDEWAVVNAIGAGDAAAALREAGRRLDRGDSPHGLVGQLRWWVSSRLAEADPDRVRGAIDALMKTDLALKSSGGEDRVLIERLVVELTGRPVPQRGWTGRR
jgi:DNA polymerase-3 subunit delta